mmetsp:Transcript_4410/g.9611  ORF Transcript_4410/g.9611 Transcript_4410/m.9611 type:complete len:217 (+) Transcript_4410:56-706(+)
MHAQPHPSLKEVCATIVDLRRRIVEEEGLQTTDVQHWAERLVQRQAAWSIADERLERELAEAREHRALAIAAKTKVSKAVEVARLRSDKQHQPTLDKIAMEKQMLSSLQEKHSDLTAKRKAREDWAALEHAEIAGMEKRLMELEVAREGRASPTSTQQDLGWRVDGRWQALVVSLVIWQCCRDLRGLRLELAAETSSSMADAKVLHDRLEAVQRAG